MQFEDLVRETIEKEFEDYYMGFTDLSLVQESLVQRYGSLLDEYPCAISIGITLPYLSPQLSSDECTDIHRKLEEKIDKITTKLTSLLQEDGYKAFTVPKIDMEGFVYLHKLAATMAKLGKIGKKGLVLTPEVGSRVNWGTILTNADLNNDS